MNRRTAFLLLIPLLLVAAMFWISAEPAHAEPSRAVPSFRTYTGSISASNAAVTSLVDASDQLVVESMYVTSNQAGTLTFTDGSAGNALLIVYVAANVRVDLPPTLIGVAGVRCTRGNELYVNALSSATISVGMASRLE